MITSATFSGFKPIIFLSILGKDSTLAGAETPTWSSASPRRRGDGVDRAKFFRGGGRRAKGAQAVNRGFALSVDD